ncbi:MAG: NAD(P)H-binding protein [Anaerolineales bacterium]|nr:NAD(P)H-binding protein [Anaerolineales bacterium]
MAERILVIGGTGMLGEPVPRQLQADGYQVRILTRSPQKATARLGKSYELAVGDVDNPSLLEAALQGCDGVHISLDGGKDYDLERRGGVNVAGAAVKAGVKRITYLSGASVAEENCWYPGTKAKFLAEKAIRESGIPYTIFNAGWFMESLSRFVHGERAFVIGKQPNATPWITAEDARHSSPSPHGC